MQPPPPLGDSGGKEPYFYLQASPTQQGDSGDFVFTLKHSEAIYHGFYHPNVLAGRGILPGVCRAHGQCQILHYSPGVGVVTTDLCIILDVISVQFCNIILIRTKVYMLTVNKYLL